MATINIKNITDTNTYSNLAMINQELDNIVKQSSSNAEAMQEKALRIEKLLKALKNGSSLGNSQDDFIIGKIREKVQYTRGLNGKGLFKTVGESNYDTGVIFEKELEIVKSAMKTIGGRLSKKMVEEALSNVSGSKTGGTKINEMLNAFIENKNYDKETTEFNEELKKILIQQGILKVDQKTGNIYKYVDKMVKIDVQGSGDDSALTFLKEYKLTDETQMALNDLNRYNFSLKTHESKYASELGNTNPLRLYATVLSALGFSDDFIFKSFNRLIVCNINSKIISDHQQHQKAYTLTTRKMMSLYELTGYGIDENNQVDFIILNNRKTGIKVYSSAYLLSQIGENKSQFRFSTTSSNNFGTVSISTRQKVFDNNI